MRRSDHGFTLIEVLVAVLVVGIMLSVAILSINVVDDDRDIQREARRFMSLVELAMDDATLQGREFGIELMTSAYRFVEYDPVTTQWAPVLNDDSLKTWQLPEDYEFTLHLEDQRILLDEAPKEIVYEDSNLIRRDEYLPHLFVFSSGDLTPFEITITRLTDDRFVSFEGGPLGTMDFVADEDVQR